MGRQKLSDSEITARLAELGNWSFAGGKLRRELRFGDFVDAFGFMAKVALVAERMNHHPEWTNVYNRVVVELSTHDVGGISELDFELARAIDGYAA